MAVNSGCWDACFFHELPHQRRGVLECLFVIVSALYAHFHANAVTIAIAAKQVAVSIVDTDVPASEVVRCGLISGVSVIHVVMSRHTLEIPVMLRSCVGASVGGWLEVVGIVYNDTLWVVVRIGVLAADVRSINFHISSFCRNCAGAKEDGCWPPSLCFVFLVDCLICHFKAFRQNNRDIKPSFHKILNNRPDFVHQQRYQYKPPQQCCDFEVNSDRITNFDKGCACSKCYYNHKPVSKLFEYPFPACTGALLVQGLIAFLVLYLRINKQIFRNISHLHKKSYFLVN